MKRRGFTLIELLAVIVILAIIALIATPIVLDIIEESKTNSNKRSIELYGDAVEQAIAQAQLNGQAIPSGKYTTEDGKTLTQGDTTLKVDYDGTKTVCDVYVSSKGTISLKNCKVNNQDVEYTYGDKIYDNGEVVYFDVTTGKSCDNYTETQSNIGVKSGCMKFYAFNDDGSDTINLLLDHNTTALIAWNSSGSNVNGPSGEFLNKLNEDTKDWIGTEVPTNYSIDQSDQPSQAKYTIDCSNYKARLIAANEVAKITGNTMFDEKISTSMFYFDTNTGTESDTCKYDYDTEPSITSGCKYGWLYDRTSQDCTDYGCLNNSDVETSGYWTISPDVSYSENAWGVLYGGRLVGGFVAGDSNFGVRPVIAVLKSKLT